MNMIANAKSAERGRLSGVAGRKVLIIVENLPVPFDRRVWQEAQALNEAGAIVSIICPKGKGYERSYEKIQGVHVHRHSLPLEGKGFSGYILEYLVALFWQSFLAWKVFFTRGFDVVHGCNPPDLVFLVAVQFKLLGRKYIFDHHDISPELYEAKFGKRGLAWKLLCAAERANFRAADVVISTNNSYREIALERGGKSPEDVFVVRSGPDLSRVQVTDSNEALKCGKRFLIGYVGVMGEQEGIDLLLESARHLVENKKRRDIQFALVGSGPHLDALKQLSAKMGLDNYVTFLGRAPDKELFEVLSTADVCVNPDRVNAMNDKSTMNKILEYMAMGKPIVQFAVTEGRYSAQEASLYADANDPVDFADKIEWLLAQPEERSRMGAYGLRRVRETMAWTYEVPNLVRAYERAFK